MLSYTSIAHGLVAGAYIDDQQTFWASSRYPYWGGIMALSYGYYINYFGLTYSLQSTFGGFIDKESYLGVRFHIGEDQHYGWIRAIVSEEISNLTVRDWAYEQTPGEGIRAGEGLLAEIPPVLTFEGAGEHGVYGVHTLTMTANELITGLEVSDFLVSNGSASNLVEVTAGLVYTIDITAVEDGAVWVTIPAGSFINGVGTANDEVSVWYTYDSSGPEIYFWLEQEFDSVASRDPMPVHFQFSREVVGFDASDVTLINCTWYDWVMDEEGWYYRIVVHPVIDGEITVGVLAGVLSDVVGRTNEEDQMITWKHDGTPPSIDFNPDFTGETTDQATAEISIIFSEWIMDFVLNDIELTNAGDAILTPISDTEYTLQLTAVEAGTVDVSIRSQAVFDVAENPNAQSSFSYTYAPPQSVEKEGIIPISIYPNPTDKTLFIEAATQVDIRIVDLYGKILYQQEKITKGSINISNLQPGIYILQISDGELIRQEKIIIQ
jgi:hypothetical protein